MNTEPKEPPERLEIRAKPRPMRRLNRKVIGVLIGAGALTVLSAVMWGFKKDQGAPDAENASQRDVERVARAEGISSLPRDYASVQKPPQLGAPVGEFGRPLAKGAPERNASTSLEGASLRPSPEEEALMTQRKQELKEAQEADRAAVFFQLKNRGSRSKTTSGNADNLRERDTGDDFLKALGAKNLDTESPDPNKQDKKLEFVKSEADSRIYASSTLQTPQSPYQLMAGTIIPAALVTGIKSDLPGQIIATVTENVFDSVSGAELLIPQGARLIGEYDSQVAYGQSRLLLVWNRLVMPDGSSILLERLPGVDTQGYAGLQDGVDWHWRRIFAGAALATVLGAGAELAAPDRGRDDNTIVVAAQESVQESVNQVGQEITRRNLDIQPTLTQRPGLPVRVIVNRDLILRPYTS